MRIWNENPNLISPRQAMEPEDADLGLFAQSVRKGYLFIDLRRGKIGDGFSWGRWGAATEIKRNGNQRLFAYRKAPNFIQKLFGM